MKVVSKCGKRGWAFPWESPFTNANKVELRWPLNDSIAIPREVLGTQEPSE